MFLMWKILSLLRLAYCATEPYSKVRIIFSLNLT